MINIILITLLIHYSLYLLIKPKNLNLSCGIFGWFGRNPKKFNKDKFDKLGIFNVDRGRTSCGVSIDGDLFLGIDNEKLYTDFIKGRNFQPKLFPYALGHTRAASVGNAISLDNVHPFGFGDLKNQDDLYEFIGCHNGTIYNAEDLAKKYNVEIKETKTVFNQHNVKQQITRTKIDSELMLEILYTNKNYKVLSEYNGTAAMVFINLNEPNAVFVWKGASKYYSSLNAVSSEERPLFYYKETRNSLYISSIEDSLLTIGGIKDETVFTFDENTIYKIIDGNVDKAIKIRVSRNNALQKESTITYPTRTVSRSMNPNHVPGSNYKKVSQNCRISLPKSKSESIKVLDEKTVRPQDEYGSRIYFNKLRYWRNGHTIKGIFTWVPGWGFLYLTESSTDVAKTMLETYVNKPFVNGWFHADRKPNKESFVPFTKDMKIENNIHYFIDGAYLKTELDFKILFEESKKFPNKEIEYRKLSHCTKHPVTDSYRNEPSHIFNDVIFEGKEFTGIICPLGAEKIYEFQNGKLYSAVESPFRTLELGFAPKSNEEKENKSVIELPASSTCRQERSLANLMGYNEDYEPNTFNLFSKGNIPFTPIENNEEDLKQSDSEIIQQLNDLIEEDLSESFIQIESLIEQIEESGVEGDFAIARKLCLLKKIKKQIELLTKDEHTEPRTKIS
jgi:hypothetical protein